MSSKRMALALLVAACAISAAYIFTFGVDWEFTLRSSTLHSAIFTALILSVWASVPYLVLMPIAQREGWALLSIVAALAILTFGAMSIDRGRHTPGDEGGSYIVVPFQQTAIAAVILFGWRLSRRSAR